MVEQVGGADAGDIVEPPWWRPSGSGAPGRDRLSREAIVDAALEVIDREGVAAVTLRRLARDLDTGPASLYWHIANKDQLFELVYDRILGEITFPDPDPDRWADQLREVARSSFEVMTRHNDAALLSLGAVPFGPNGLRMIEWTLAVLRGAGFADHLAGFFGDLLGRFIDASVLEETRGRGRDTGAAADAEQMAMMGSYIAMLPPDRYPNIIAMVPAMFSGDAESRFELGLDLLLAGLAAHLPPDESPPT